MTAFPAAAPAPFPVTVHPFKSPTSFSCAYEQGASSSKNALVFIGGLGDGPHTVPYVHRVAKELASSTSLSYSVFETRLRSSFGGFGYRRLSDDAADISALVKYLHGIGKQKVVLMGHSTGCQDGVEYANATRYSNEPVDGFILQATVSDREAIMPLMSKEAYEDSISYALELIKSGREKEFMPSSKLPKEFDSPITAYRWFSLAGRGGDDDFFSSDLSDDEVEAVWGRFKQPVLILPSGEDEHVPKEIDVPAQLQKWKSHCAPGIASELSDLIPGATHNVKQAASQEWLAHRVASFLESLEK